ncbi:MAG: hypothetical protein N2738_01935, partial [Thermodesulfovibrionales bacterium]|nr:hypothetical protein [Thermodesulfovibrionales bacterium]
FAVKEEILSTVLKKHNTVFLSGWSKTGKTKSALKTIGFFEVRLYFSHNRESTKLALSIDPEIQILGSLSTYSSVDSDDTILVIDDYSNANSDIRQEVAKILGNKKTNTRILLIVRAFIDIKELIVFADALIRFKKNTAEVIFSRLQEAENV